jgi:hypothetical protein
MYGMYGFFGQILHQNGHEKNFKRPSAEIGVLGFQTLQPYILLYILYNIKEI